MAWERQLNCWDRHICPADTMSFATCINIGRAAYDKLGLDRYHSADLLLDFDTKPAKLGIQLHVNGKGEFRIQSARKASGRIASISCGSVLTKLRKRGIGSGRYHFRIDQPEFLVFDLDLPAKKIGGQS